jgi:hypothetical protein
VRVPEKSATEVAFALDNGKAWIVLRPQAGAAQSPPSLVTLDRLLLGLPPISVNESQSNNSDLIKKVYGGKR